MKIRKTIALPQRCRWPLIMVGVALLWAGWCIGQSRPREALPGAATVLGFRGKVEVQRTAQSRWDPAFTNQVLDVGNRLRTDANSQALLKYSDRETIPIGPRSVIRLDPPTGPRRVMSLLEGILYFFHRDEPEQFELRTPGMNAIVRGTEFVLEVGSDGASRLSLIDGEVVIRGPVEEITIGSGTEVVAQPGGVPRITPLLEVPNVIQWRLYYPAVLVIEDLGLSAEAQAVLAESLTAYRAGDLFSALSLYPRSVAGVARSEAERVYSAALQLQVGNVKQAEVEFRDLVGEADPTTRAQQVAVLLLRLIDLVKGRPAPAALDLDLASARLVDSLWFQARWDLKTALTAARKAVSIHPESGFGWVRVAELEFGFGRLDLARQAVDRGIQLAPRHAQAVALRGFLQAAASRFDDALASFDLALSLDSTLGNAWLGRGLCRIRQGETKAGRADLQTAAALEPNRALLRSYLAKAFQAAGDSPRAAHELGLALQLDPLDPTAWLFSALVAQENNRANQAVRDLERSMQLGQNRAVYRSPLLLDQDQAARGANLARVYADAGLGEVGLRAAARAVSSDYANPSAHQFLADSYSVLNDIRRSELRYEAPQAAEYLLATLLSPVGGTPLSPNVSLQEYSRLFEQDGVHFASRAEYFDRGAWSENAIHYGRSGKLGYSVEALQLSDPGDRPNNDVDSLAFSAQAKLRAGLRDTFYVQGLTRRTLAGDLNVYRDPDQANEAVRYKETQTPILLAGWHREWRPGSHTLLLFSHLQDTLRADNPGETGLLINRPGPMDAEVFRFSYTNVYRSIMEVDSVEVQQIWQSEANAWVIGGRQELGRFRTRSHSSLSPAYSVANGQGQVFESDFEHSPQELQTRLSRRGAYAWWNWRPIEVLQLSAGISYDQLRYPYNHRYAPISDRQVKRQELSPKLGAIWSPLTNLSFQVGYGRSLGGVSFEHSGNLEPTRVGGINQSWRGLIPEAVAGPSSAPELEILGLGMDVKLAGDTYVGMTFDWLRSQVDRAIGAYDYLANPPFPASKSFYPALTRQDLDFDERSMTVSIDRLVGQGASLGVKYRLSRAALAGEFSDLVGIAQPNPDFSPKLHRIATLHQLDLHALYRHSSGFFGQATAHSLSQSNSADDAAWPTETFWQVDAILGYRSPRRIVEVRVGLLNAFDRDFRLNPLNLTAPFPRARTWFASLQLSF